MANRIHSKGAFRQDEAKAGAAGIYPGMLIMLNSSGDVVVHATEGGWAEKAFAQEDALQGNTIATVYANGAIVTYILPAKAGCVNALLETGYSYAIGDHLISAGNGKLMQSAEISSDGTLAEVLAVCEEAVDLSDSVAVDTLGRVRVL